MSTDNGPGRLEGEALLPLTRAARKFGIAKCALCGERFIKHRHGQKFCCRSHAKETANRRAGQVSGDPRWAAARQRKRLAAVRTASKSSRTYPTGNVLERPKNPNGNNTLQGAFWLSSMGISGSGTSRAVFREILALELANVPLIRSVPAA